MEAGLTIGKVALETGVAATTLRYYEQVGLLPAPGPGRGSAPLRRLGADPA
jgi:DNA-binding transcriptional MerR regulator